jgi:hypothetical protein
MISFLCKDNNYPTILCLIFLSRSALRSEVSFGVVMTTLEASIGTGTEAPKNYQQNNHPYHSPFHGRFCQHE